MIVKIKYETGNNDKYLLKISFVLGAMLRTKGRTDMCLI